MISRLKGEYFTDPLCSWSWSNEPNYRKLREEFGDQIEWQHRMGGLMERFSPDFYDPLYGLSGGDAKALAKHQEEVSLENLMPIDVGFWFKCPPASSHPFCIAVKAVGLQGRDLEDLYLRRVREAILVEKHCLKGKEDLLKLAEDLPGIDLQRLARDIDGDAARNAFKEDFEACRHPVPEAKDTKVTEGHLRYSFPTLLLFNRSGEYRVIDGNDLYEAYLKAIKELDPKVKQRRPPDLETFLKKYRRVAAREVQVVCEIPWDKAVARLDRMVEEGRVQKRRAGHFDFYQLKEPLS